MTTYRRWGEAELDVLYRAYVETLGQEGAFERIAQRLPGRSVVACRAMAERQGWYRTAPVGPDGVKRLNLRDVARILGRHFGSVLHWVKLGKLSVTAHRGTHVVYAITEEELWAWMENPASWHCWEPETLRDPVWREHFSELRREWLSTGEAAERLLYARDSLCRVREQLGVRSVGGKRALWWHAGDVERVRRERMAA